MPLYHYKALDGKGKKITGSIEGESERDAKSILREQGVLVTHIAEKTATSSKENLKGESLLSFTVQLSQLISAGVPLYDSLIAIEEQYRKERFHRVILSLCEQIKKGIPLSAAMAGFPDSFNNLYCSMIKAGESVGALDTVLEKMGEFLKKQAQLKKQITTAMIYPCILGGFALLVICLLLGFVLPSIEGIFQGRKLNEFTSFVLEISRIFRTYYWIYLPVLFAFIGGIYYKARTKEGKLWLEKIYLKTPLVRTLVIQTAMARFCRTIGTLLGGGLPMIESLRLSRKVMYNSVLEMEIENTETKIIEGSTFSSELSKSKYIPKMVSRMLSVGEDSGTTTIMLNKIADIYEEEIQKSLDRLLALMQPVILLVMGGIIAIVLLAILLPLTDVSSLSG